MTAPKPVVLVTGADLAHEALHTLAEFEVVYAGARPQETDLVDLVLTHDPIALIVRYGRITAKVIDAARSLKVISKHGSGIDTIDSEAAARRGIVVKAASGANAAAVAEHAIALLLGCAKSIIPLNGRMQHGHWDKATHKSIELEGRTLGVIGLGAIGRRTAAIAHAMGMRILGHDPYAQNLPAYIEHASLNQIWPQAHAITLHCPLTEENKRLINADTLAQCRDGVIIVNTARGGLIDDTDLIDAIRSGKVFGAGLDSFHTEPPSPDHALAGEPAIVLTPHVGGVTGDAYVKMGCAAAANVLEVLRA